MIMNQSTRKVQGLYKKRTAQRNSTTTSTCILSFTLLFVFMTLVSMTKYVSGFAPNGKTNHIPTPYHTSINRCTNRLTSQGSVRFKSRHIFRHRDRDRIEVDVDDGLPLVLQVEGLFAVDKPLEWTSQDVVSYIRGMFERDARLRGAKPGKIGSKNNKGRPVVRCGHGGTLDPLATGVLVIGLGSGTKLLQAYLKGSKGYRAEGTFGFETETLDMAGNVTKNAGVDHITRESLEAVIPHFKGKYLQDPPIYSAIHKEGKRLHELARAGLTAEDVDIQPRAVEVFELDLLDFNSPKFEIDVTCASGFYIRSLIRDIGYSVDSVATTSKLQRTKLGPFTMDHALPREDWTIEKINAVIEKLNTVIVNEDPVDALPSVEF